MMRKTFIIILLLALAAAISYLLLFAEIMEKRYNKIMCYYIASKVTRDSHSFEAKVTALRDFVHETVHPISGYHNRLDTVAIEKLTSGIGWCDQNSRVFMQLARSIGITTRLLFLRNESGSSPHSIAEALAPDGRWVLVDPSYNLDFITKDGRFASQIDIKKDPGIIANNKRVKLQAKFEPRWADLGYLAIYSNEPIYVITKEGIDIDLLRPVPVSWLRPIVHVIQNRYFKEIKPDFKHQYEFIMIEGRGYHLLGYYKKSAALYDDTINNSDNLQLKRKTEFYKAVLLKDEGKYQDAVDYIKKIIEGDNKNPYVPYLLGLSARVLYKLGKFKEAEEILRKAEYSLEI